MKENALLFLHIPKAGGTTVNSWLFDQIKSVEPGEHESRWFKHGVFHYPSGFIHDPDDVSQSIIERTLKNHQPRAVLGHFPFGIHHRLTCPSSYITLVRDPVERVVSLYHFQKLVQKKRGSHHGIVIPEDMTLREFVALPPYPEIENGQTRRIAGVTTCNEQTLDIAMGNLERFFAVAGVLDRFDETLLMIKQAFEWETASAYFPKNENPTRPPVSEISDATTDFIRSRNDLDCRLYEFVRERFESAILSKGSAFQEALQKFRRDQDRLREEVIQRKYKEDMTSHQDRRI